jgi:hypothetical protein
MIYRRRRYLRAKADEAQFTFGECGQKDPIAAMHEQTLEATPAVETMPDGFPHAAKLAERGYSALDELRFATEAELQKKGFSRGEARTIVAAVKAVPIPSP